MHGIKAGCRYEKMSASNAYITAAMLSAVIVGPASVAAADAEPSSAPAPQHTDPLGRPLSWGEAVDGRRASVSMLATRLLYGQPIEFRLLVPNPARRPPFVVGVFSETSNRAVAELTDESGKAVAHEVLRRGGSRGTDGTDVRIRVRPNSSSPHAMGRYLRPGRYRLRVVIDCKRDPAIPTGWVGTLASNTLLLTILPAGARQRQAPVSDAVGRKAAALARQLGDNRAANRQAAQAALEAMGFDALAALEKALTSPDEEVVSRATTALWRIVSAIATLRHVPPVAGTEPIAYAVAGFGPASWRVVRDNVPPHLHAELQSLAVRYGPTGPPVAMDPPSDAVARRVLAGLADEDPLVRLRTLRGISLTSDRRIIDAVVACLADSYGYRPSNVFDGSMAQVHPVRVCAESTLQWLGRRAVPSLIEAAGRATDDKSPIPARAMALLRRAGADDRTLAFCRDRLRRAGPSAAVIRTLGACGPKAAPLLAELTRRAPADLMPVLLRALADTGAARAAEPVVGRALASPNGEAVSSACAAAERLRLRACLPRIVAVCRNEGLDFNHRHAAMRAACSLSPPAAARLMLELTADAVNEPIRAEAATLLGRLDHRPALPRLLELLEDDSGLVRSRADGALRVLARKPAGVGFDDNVFKSIPPATRRREAEKWRRWFRVSFRHHLHSGDGS